MCKIEKLVIFYIFFSMILVNRFVLSEDFSNQSAPIIKLASWKKFTEEAFRLYKNGEYEKAIQRTRDALEMAKKEFGSESLQVAESIGNLAALYEISGQTTESGALYEQARAIRTKHGQKGIPLGIQSEVFFDRVEKLKSKAIKKKPEEKSTGLTVQMEEYTRLNCDFDGDGDCDNDDFGIFQTSLGKCENDFSAVSDVLADIDGDGCVTMADQEYLFPDKKG